MRRNQNSNRTVGDGWSQILNIPPSNPAVKVTGVMAICSMVMVGTVELLVHQLYMAMKALRNEQLINSLVNDIFVGPNEGKDVPSTIPLSAKTES